MKKAIKILQTLKETESNYAGKVKLLAEIIGSPTVGHICPKDLVDWSKGVGLETACHCEDRTSWWTVSGA